MGRPCILSEPEQVEVAKLYTAGRFPITHIARAYGLWPQPVRTALEKQGAKFRGRSMFGRKKAKKIKVRYENGESIAQISADLGVSPSPVKTALDSLDVDIRPNRTYFFDEHIFDVIDTEEKAYWFMFIYADGYVADTTTRVTLANRDIGHIKKLRGFVGGNMPFYKTNHDSHELSLHSIHLVESLASKGIVPYRGKFCLARRSIPNHLIKHAIRGYVDGDGCISTNEQVVILGQEDILLWIQSHLHTAVGASLDVSPRQRSGIMEIGWGGSYQFRRIVRYLYRDANVYLERKMKRAVTLAGVKR